MSEDQTYRYTKPCPRCGGNMMPETWFSDHFRRIESQWESWQCTEENCRYGVDFGLLYSLPMKLGFNRGQLGRIGKRGSKRLDDLYAYAEREGYWK